MRIAFAGSALVLTLWLGLFSSGNVLGAETSDCKLIADALHAASQLHEGMIRSNVQKDFQLDGGIAFPGSATYVYRRCPYIKIDIEFDAQNVDRSGGLSGSDRITKLSRPYLAYPSRD